MPLSKAGSSRAGSIDDRSQSPLRSHRRVPTANDFPVPGDYHPYAVKTRDQGVISPATSSYSFQDNDPLQFHAIGSRPPSPVPSLSYSVSTPRNDIEKELMVQNLYRGGVADGLPQSTPTRTPHERELARKRSIQHYQEVFALKEPNLSPKDRIYKDSVITVDVKTNVIVSYSLVLPLLYKLTLSQRSETNTSSLTSSPSTSPNATNALPPPFSSHLTTPPVSSSQAPSTPPIFLLSMPCPPNSTQKTTNATQP